MTDVHTRGTLIGTAHGIMEGGIEFPIRGVIHFRLERKPNDHVGECAALTCFNPPYTSICDMVLIQEIDEPDYWHGFIAVSGYEYQVRGERAPGRLVLSFIDAIQPIFPKL